MKIRGHRWPLISQHCRFETTLQLYFRLKILSIENFSLVVLRKLGIKENNLQGCLAVFACHPIKVWALLVSLFASSVDLTRLSVFAKERKYEKSRKGRCDLLKVSLLIIC